MAAVINSQKKKDLISLSQQVDVSLRRLLSEQNRDPYAPAFGCFDRRRWAWKLVDFPEATFQRNVYPLAWKLNHFDCGFEYSKSDLQAAVTAGLLFSFEIQHRDGSFDQAFPNEHSYGATAFLLQPLLESYKIIKNNLNNQERLVCEEGLHRATHFLVTKAETHGLISNHIAGAALSLLLAGDHFQEQKFKDCGFEIIDTILNSQNSEGWFPEYGAADPGYQSLCIYYLAQAYRLHPTPRFKASLSNAIDFLAWFIHPDGSFGGEYGSRRTSVYYPGGIALLADEFPLAAGMTDRMVKSINQGHTVGLQDIDIGNLAPLLQNTILTLDMLSEQRSVKADILPCDKNEAVMDFSSAGLSVRGSKNYYTVVGIANGGVIKVFQKPTGTLLYDDGGYSGILKNGKYISTQLTLLDRIREVKPESISVDAPFYEMLRSLPSPLQFTMLRILNLTLMRSIWVGNLVKSILVKLLIQGEKQFPLRLTRTINFQKDMIEINDVLYRESKLNLRSLSCGIPFTSIHMASARYYQGQSSDGCLHPTPVDVSRLSTEGHITQRIKI